MKALAIFGILLALTAPTVRAQSETPAPKPDTPALRAERALPPDRGCYFKPDTCETRTFYLANATQQNDANEILIAIRNIVSPSVKIYLVASQSAIIMQATPEDLKLAEKIIADTDRPKKSYRLTFTLTDSESGKRTGTQHFTMIVVSGQKTTLKQGNKVPIATGSYSNGGADSKTGPGVQTQYTYIDVGINFDTTLNEAAHGAILRAKVEQSSITKQSPGSELTPSVLETEPVIRQTVLEGTSFLTPGKPVILGSLDLTGSTHHVDIDVMMEPLP